MEILNDNQPREYNRAQAAALYFLRHTGVCKLYLPFANEVDMFSENNNRLFARM